MMRVGALIALFFSTAVAAGETPRPNILLLMAEDMSPRVGAFGDQVAVTPNLDKLASEGVRFANVFTAAGVCAPSRAAQITGMHPASIGAQHMRAVNRPAGGYKAVPPPVVKAYPELLRAAGYFTFTDEKLDYQFSEIRNGTGPATIWDSEGAETNWSDRDADQPFFGLINFLQTHESGVFPPLGTRQLGGKYLAFQRYRDQHYGNPDDHPFVAPEDVEVPPYYPDDPTVRVAIARHYNNIALMDRQVSELLDRLERDGLADNTIVIWTTDHGDGLPRAKREVFDSGIKVPMIIRWPERYRPAHLEPGQIDSRLLSFVDLAPTILALAGVDAPDYLPGQNFLDPSVPERRYVFASRDRMDVVRDRQRAVRDRRYKYIRSWHPEQPGGHRLEYRDNLTMMQTLWKMLDDGQLNALQRHWFEPPGEEQLYDTRHDPFELHNLAGSPEHRETLNRMRTALADWLQINPDWSEQPEATMVAGFWPDGEQPVTAGPSFRWQAPTLTIHCETNGASLGYRVNGGRWQVYSGAFSVDSGDIVEALTVRYGWRESEVAQFEVPR
ncbi:MAG: sulfatase [Gammaproteobacteria bacterium]|nr:sulfatase [Gammaproteobacteria bacterium]